MSKHRDEILRCLARAIRRDAEKGGDGSRTTTEVAEWLGVRTAVARRALNAMLAAGLVEWEEPVEGLGNVHFWRLAAPEGDDGDGEPVPLALNDNEPAARELAA